MTMGIKEIRKLASTVGVFRADVDTKKLHPNTRNALWKLGLRKAPYGVSPFAPHLDRLFTEERFLELQPDSAGKRLAARFERENGSQFALGVGIYHASWQWFPDIYRDENGTPNQLVVTGDGFALTRIRFGTDGIWRWDWVQDPEIVKERYGTEAFSRLPETHKVYVAFEAHYAPGILAALGLPNTDPTMLIGQPVTEDDFIRATKRDPAFPRR